MFQTEKRKIYINLGVEKMENYKSYMKARDIQTHINSVLNISTKIFFDTTG